MDASIIIVNYNSGDCLRRSVRSVLQQEDVTKEIIVIDNLSTDDSLSQISEYENKVKIIQNKRNLGFGLANNIAFRKSYGRYIVLLNPDAAFSSPTDLQKLVSYMDEHKECGISGPTIFEGANEVKPNYIYPGEKHVMHRYNYLPGDIAWLLGACLVIRRDLYDKSEGFDPDFFLYGEEVDLCLRSRQLGEEIHHVPFTTVQHVGGVSARSVDVYSRWLQKQRGLLLFYQKSYCRDDFLRLVKLEKKRAKRRLYLLNLEKTFKGKKQLIDKIDRYSAIYDVSKKCLSDRYVIAT